MGSSEGADRQLFEYAFHQGVPIAVLTDGQEWSFYLPAEQGRYDERRVYKLDLLERTTGEAKERLNRFLSYERICSGEALEAARSDYQDVAHNREMERTFPKACKSLLEEPDSLLPELLAKKVEDLCGYKPDFDMCSEFLESIRSGLPPGDTLFEQRPHQPLRPSLSGAADLNNRRSPENRKLHFQRDSVQGRFCQGRHDQDFSTACPRRFEIFRAICISSPRKDKSVSGKKQKRSLSEYSRLGSDRLF